MWGWITRIFGHAPDRAPPPVGPPAGYAFDHSFETTLAGANRRQREMHEIRVGDVVSLRREPSNPVDPNAIAVFSSKSHMVGYIPAHVAERLARQIDQGWVATADVVEILDNRDEFKFENCLIEVHLYREPNVFTDTERAELLHHHAESKRIAELVERVRQLKREAKFIDVEPLLLAECDRQEKESGTIGVAPWAYEQLAIVYRRTKRHPDEIAILERYERQTKAPGVKPQELAARLEKLRTKSND